LSQADAALVELGRTLADLSYEFVTVTPETHRRVLARDRGLARDLRDVFGWNRAFDPAVLPSPIAVLMQRAGVWLEENGNFRASVRFSTLGSHLLVHSGFPTTASDSVFFGPDTYRFCAYLGRHLGQVGTVVDVGCGSGAGGLVAAHRARRVVLSDVNDQALRLARVNATLAGAAVELVNSDVLASVLGAIDLVIANPPYMRDAAHRTYRDGGGNWGEGLSLRIARESLQRLGAGGRLVLYTGAPIVRGRDVFRDEVTELCREAGAAFVYEELDPDVFGEQLGEPFYEEVERIAAVGLVATKR
jgi:SAM-dependent methyltransferase